MPKYQHHSFRPVPLSLHLSVSFAKTVHEICDLQYFFKLGCGFGFYKRVARYATRPEVLGWRILIAVHIVVQRLRLSFLTISALAVDLVLRGPTYLTLSCPPSINVDCRRRIGPK